MNLDALRDDAAGLLPGCPRNAILLELRKAAVALCDRTGAWREKITENVVSGARIHTLESKWDADIVSVAAVYLRTAQDVAEETDSRVKDRDGRRLCETEWSATLTDGIVKLALRTLPAESITKGLRAVVVLRPVSRGLNLDLDESFLTLYRAGIVGKAVAELAMRTRRPWSDVDEAVRAMKRYQAAVVDARTAVETGNRGGASEMGA